MEERVDSPSVDAKWPFPPESVGSLRFFSSCFCSCLHGGIHYEKRTRWHLVENAFVREASNSYAETFSHHKLLRFDWLSSVHSSGFILTIHDGVQAEALSTIIQYDYIMSYY